jgi:GT2 family glycosyltransferase
MLKNSQVTVAIPTFGRDNVLTDTIKHLLNQSTPTSEILVVDQTYKHDLATEKKLFEWNKNGEIRWKRLLKPSITRSMNIALSEAYKSIVLFVDDDIIPAQGLIAAHEAAYRESDDIWAVSGQVLQLGEEPFSDSFSYKQNGLYAWLDFRFCSTSRAWAKSVMAGNLSVRRDKALEIGGFDENFIGVAYRFETEFCRRIWQHGGKVLFEPKASIRHLRTDQGGTRRFGNHLCSPSPMHGVGDYYFALRQGFNSEILQYILRRPFREISTKFHLKNPLWIPVKLLGEMRALLLAVKLYKQGPKLIRRSEDPSTIFRTYGASSGQTLEDSNAEERN